jgi:glutamate/tyrosine decarboxylase-like PLP-dependent enzyme
MYFSYTDWVGGMYITPSFVGSRSGFASAGAWYSLTHVGRKQFIENAEAVADATKSAAEKLRKIEGVQVIGHPELCAIGFQTTSVSIFAVSDYLIKQKQWNISPIHLPDALHISLTVANCENVKKHLAADVA